MDSTMEDESIELNLSSYTNKELRQLLKLAKSTLDHYASVQKDTAMFEKLREGDRMAFNMLLQQAQGDEKDLLDELKRRKNMKCRVKPIGSPDTTATNGQVSNQTAGAAAAEGKGEAADNTGTSRRGCSSDSDSSSEDDSWDSGNE